MCNRRFPSEVKIDASESIDHSEEYNKYNGDNNSAAKGGVVTNAPTGNTSSSVVDLTTTSSVFPMITSWSLGTGLELEAFG